MTKKIKDVYAWVEEQDEYWDDLTSEKLKQLDDITNSHLDWFNKHATISDILSWKKPVIDLNNPDKQVNQIDSGSPRSFNNNNEITSNQQNSCTSPKVSIHEEEISLNQQSPALIQPQKRDSTSSKVSIHEEEISLNQQSPALIQPQQRDSASSEIMACQHIEEEITYSHIAPELRYLFNSNSDTSSTDFQPPSPDNDQDIHLEFKNVLETTATTNDTILSVESSSLTDISLDDIRSVTPELDTQSNTQSQNAPSTPKGTEDNEISPAISPKRNYQLENQDEDEDDDEDDEIQLLVPKRHYEPESNKCIVSPARPSTTQSPIRTASKHYTSPHRNLPPPPPLPSFNLSSPNRSQTTTLENTSPSKAETNTLENTSPSKPETNTLENTNLSPPTSRPYQSPFMARLFKLTQNSSEDSKNFVTVRPRPSESGSSITSARDNDYNMNLLESKNKKRPIESVSESIEVSDAIPQPYFKRSRTSNLGKTSSVSNIPPPPPAAPPSSIATSPKPVNSINKEENKENINKGNQEEDDDEEHEYPIPSWAKSPELNKHLKNQEGMDPDSIFGPIPSLNIEEIFAHPEIYLTEDDN